MSDPGLGKYSERQHAYPGTIMMGAQNFLIPYHIPLRFFICAAVFQVVAWLLLAIGSGEVAGYGGGTGVVLASLHSLTLGVLVMTSMGASYQLLNVATGHSTELTIGRVDISRLSSWFYIPGTVLLVAGMAGGNSHAMLLGGTLVVVAMAAFAAVVGRILLNTAGLIPTVRHGWAALACLALLAVAGLVLIVDFDVGFLGTANLPTHTDLAIGHAILGGFGFMGMMVLGFSYILVPMFALSAAPDERHSGMSFGLVLSALIIAAPGALAGSQPAIILGAALALAGVTVHLSLMFKAIRDGMKKRLGLSFVMVRGGWIALPLTIIVGAMAAADTSDYNLQSLFGFMLVFGWLLTFLTGILQRILPFLTSMHAHKLGKRAPRLSELGHQKITLRLHAACHGIALVLVSAGILSETDTLILAGGLSGSLGAAAFLWFTLGVSRIVVAIHGENNLAKQP